MTTITLTGHSWTAHAYVLSSAGHAWECGGGTYGSGNQLCSGTSDATVADCISRGWRSMAGLLYGVTGVCHQAANRILYQTGNHVWFWAVGASYPLYGYYGSFGIAPAVLWHVRKAECGALLSQNQNSPTTVSKEGNSLDNEDKRLHDFLQDLLVLTTLNKTERFQLFGESKDPLADTGYMNQEFKLWMEYRLGEKNASEEKLEEIIRIQNLLFQNTLTARSNLLEGKSDPKQNAYEINRQISICLKSIKDVLGAEDYQRVFETNDTDVTVVDPEIVLDAYNDGVYRDAEQF